MDYYIKILQLIDSGNEDEIFEKAKRWNILLHPIDIYDNNLIHLAAKRNMLILAEKVIKEDKNDAISQNIESNRIINDQNEKNKTPLDLSETNEMTDLIREYGGKTSLEIQKEWEDMEDSYYSAMDDISKIQTAIITSNKMFDAIINNEFIEFKRLYEINSLEGGLLLCRLSARNKSGQTFFELAKQLGRKDIMEYLKNNS